jgi:hypothetical protein
MTAPLPFPRGGEPARPRIRPAYARQIEFPRAELVRLQNRIEEDYGNALADHEARMRRFQRYYMRWRNRTELPYAGEEERPNFRVPITQWQVYAKLAKEMQALFGDDAEVIAKPTGPEDQRIVRKIGRFQTWRVFDSMKIVNPATTFNFRKILFGRAHAYAPYTRDVYRVPTIDGGWHEEVYYEGPGFDPLWPDDVIVPAEDARTLQDFSFFIHKTRATPDELLRGDGTIYSGVREHFQKIVTYAKDRRNRDSESERVKQEKDLAEGVLYEGNLSAGSSLVVHNWYGRWRRLKGRRDAREDNLQGRDLFESELVIRYLPDLNLIVGVQDLAEMYPRMKHRRPFVEGSLMKDGSYWGLSFGEMLETIEGELSKNHNLAAEAGEISVGPVIFYRPGSGFDPDTFRYRPRTAIACDDPNAIKPVSITADLRYPVLAEQAMLGYAERVTGISDMNLGRSVDRPNAPKTARQTLALLEEGDVRAAIDTMALREDWGEILNHFWLLDSQYTEERVFFRVTEEAAEGLFDVGKGGAFMEPDELGGRYDFSLKFATNAWSKEQAKQNQLALYQLDLQNPLVVQNPQALWHLLDKIHRAFGDDHFSDIVPRPPDPGLPIEPRVEHTRLLQGMDVRVNPLDNDQLHLIEHNRELLDMRTNPNRDMMAYGMLTEHALEHIKQHRMKQMMTALTAKLADSLAGGQGGLAMAAPGQMALGGLQQTITQILAGNGQNPDGTPAEPDAGGGGGGLPGLPMAA